ncbi:hypothetical protein BV898_04869 [Hypsibius exemplaris]|uniref:SSD domain-containing protein n=1 Tax=Hypsibius exemplaris TaxID=2072580 RepID=A0A1W0X0X7_HYPEX|nr:hypothetical protein BV898_04869 [Hypsibius exemplaris]
MENQNVPAPSEAPPPARERVDIYAISGISSSSTESSGDPHGRCSSWPTCGLEDRTYRIGRLLGTYPFLSIIIAISIVATGSMGFLNFHIESRVEELWVPPDSPAYLAKSTSRTFAAGSRITLSIMISAPEIFEPDIFRLMLQIDSIIRNFTFRGKGWEILCFRKNAECQRFSLLNVLDISDYESLSRESIIFMMNQSNRRRNGFLPPYFISLDDILANTLANSSGYVVGAKFTRMVYYLQKQDKDRITSSKPVEPEEMLRRRLVDQFGQGFDTANVTIRISLTYADGDPGHVTSLWSMDYFLSLLYACIAYLLVVFIATGKYTATRHGFWLAVSGVIGIALALAFGFGIASAVGMAFTSVHLLLPILFLSMSVFGYLVIESELRLVSDARSSLGRGEKMGMTMQRSFGTLVLCMLSNFLVFAVGIGSRLPVVRSFCVFGVTSAVGIFITQILFLFGCLSAWQGTYERSANAWICCVRRPDRVEKEPASFHAILKPVFGFLASNLSENIPRALVLVAVAVLTGVCIYFIFSLRIVFDMARFDQSSSVSSGAADASAVFRQTDEAIGCVYLGDIPYQIRQSELRTFQSYLKEHAMIRPRSVMSWFDRYQVWMADQQRLRTIKLEGREVAGQEVSVFEKGAFYRSVTKFVAEKNFDEDVVFVRKGQDEVEIQACRICFRFQGGLQADNYSSAAQNIASIALDLQLGTALVNSDLMLSVLVQKVLATELWILFGAYFVVLLIIAALMLQSVVTALVVFVSFALLTMHSIGIVSSQKISMDSLVLVSVFCFVSIASQMLFYEATIFTRLSGKVKSKTRLKSTMISGGPPALACAVCAITTLVPFFDSTSEMFRVILRVSISTISLALVHVFLFLPVSLSLGTPEVFSTATLRLRNRFRRRQADTTSPEIYYDGGVGGHHQVNPIHDDSPLPLPNDQVHFVARNPVSPLQRASSTSSTRIDLKNEGLRAVLDSLSSPAESVRVVEEEPEVSTNPNGEADYDSLRHLQLVGLDESHPIETIERAESAGPIARDRSVPSSSRNG